MNATCYACIHMFVNESCEPTVDKFLVIQGIRINTKNKIPPEPFKFVKSLAEVKSTVNIAVEEILPQIRSCLADLSKMHHAPFVFGFPPMSDDIYSYYTHKIQILNGQLYVNVLGKNLKKLVCPFRLQKRQNSIVNQETESLLIVFIIANILDLSPITVANLSISECVSYAIQSQQVRGNTEVKVKSYAQKLDKNIHPLKLQLHSTVGMHNNVAVVDFESLYPNILLKQKWPLKFKHEEFYFILKNCLEKKKKTKGANCPQYSKQCKFIANAFYGLLGYKNFFLCDKVVCFNVRKKGLEVLQKALTFVESTYKDTCKVIGGRTDSLMVCGIPNVNQLLSEIEQECGYPIKIDYEFELLVLTSNSYVGKKKNTEEGDAFVYNGTIVNRACFTEEEKFHFKCLCERIILNTNTTEDDFLDYLQSNSDAFLHKSLSPAFYCTLNDFLQNTQFKQLSYLIQ